MAASGGERRRSAARAVEYIVQVLTEDTEPIESDVSDDEDPAYILPDTERGQSIEDVQSSSDSDSEPQATPSSTTLHESVWTGKDGTEWSADCPTTGRFRNHNVVNDRLHHVRASSAVYTPKDAFLLFMTENIIEEVLLCTNKKGRRSAIAEGKSWLEVEREELLAFFGILLMAGVEKNWDMEMRKLFLDPKQNPIYKATFGVNRFQNLMRHLRFDDARTRLERLKTDKLAAFSFIWDLFIRNCTTQFSLGLYATVDEQLVPYRGRSPITQYMPSKPAKYGLKIFWLCDASVPYASNALIYAGKPPGSKPEKNLGEKVVLRLAAPIRGTGRNITMDNYFTSVSLAKKLLQEKLTLVGTIKTNRREIPEVMKACKTRVIQSSIFGFHENLTVVSYVSKKNKSVILLSTMHHDASVDESDVKLRPEIIKFYNKTKIGVDLIDQMVGTYTCKRQTRRWPMALFFYLLDIAALNAYTIFTQLNPHYAGGHCSRRRHFLTELAESLIWPRLLNRQKIPQLPKATKEAMLRCGVPVSVAFDEFHVGKRKRKRCYFCPSALDRKVSQVCGQCNKHVCRDHGSTVVKTTCKNCTE